VSPSDPLLQQVKGTSKYAALADDVVIAAIASARRGGGREADVVKRARRKLHQVSGAFLDAADRKRALARLGEAADAPDDERWRALLVAAMGVHSSTAERIDELPALWEGIRAAVGPIGSVLDLGCGLGPLMLPWSGLPPDVRWLGIDVDEVVCAAVSRALAARHPGVEVRAADARSAAVSEAFDLALLLKLVPTLDQLEPGSGAALVARVPAQAVALSFPSRTLGGRNVGMVERYDAAAAAMLAGWERLGTISLGAERVHLARRRDTQPGCGGPAGS
jgi:16S rRNA (guanine(1405)-N(7))-methyltransferase